MANSLFIDVHILQTVPPSNINRDDTGSPKSARFGGVRRARVSSQAWKKATRDLFPDMLDEGLIGIRTKYAVEMIADCVLDERPNIKRSNAVSAMKKVFGDLKIKTEEKDGHVLTSSLLFISRDQCRGLANEVVNSIESGKPVAKAVAKEALDDRENRSTVKAVDIAMFGRMVATEKGGPDLNVDASVQVAHAIGIGKMEPEFDYFTALDDRSPEDNAGAAMIETTEFTSSTMYRYANVDVLHLCENLGSAQVACRAVEAFLRSFTLSMPTGKQNSFANRTLPAAVVIQLRGTQPVSLVNAFEKPVEPRDGKSQVEIACERLAAQEEAIDDAFGTAPQKTLVIVASPDAAELPGKLGAGACNLEDAAREVSQACASFLAESGYPLEEEN